MEVRQYNVYKFSELPEESQQKALDKYRDFNVTHYWYEFIFEDFKNEMKEKNIEVDKIYFSGFWSQGDGASFTGRVTLET